MIKESVLTIVDVNSKCPFKRLAYLQTRSSWMKQYYEELSGVCSEPDIEPTVSQFLIPLIVQLIDCFRSPFIRSTRANR